MPPDIERSQHTHYAAFRGGSALIDSDRAISAAIGLHGPVQANDNRDCALASGTGMVRQPSYSQQAKSSSDCSGQRFDVSLEVLLGAGFEYRQSCEHEGHRSTFIVRDPWRMHDSVASFVRRLCLLQPCTNISGFKAAAVFARSQTL
jgi:hypothetical protein